MDDWIPIPSQPCPNGADVLDMRTSHYRDTYLYCHIRGPGGAFVGRFVTKRNGPSGRKWRGTTQRISSPFFHGSNFHSDTAIQDTQMSCSKFSPNDHRFRGRKEDSPNTMIDSIECRFGLSSDRLMTSSNERMISFCKLAEHISLERFRSKATRRIVQLLQGWLLCCKMMLRNPHVPNEIHLEKHAARYLDY